MREPSSTSAFPTEQMRRYATQASALDEELGRESARLAMVLERFDTICVEPGCRLPPLAPLASELRRLAREAAELSHWVAVIAERVDEADRPVAAAPATVSAPTVAGVIGETSGMRSVLLQTAPEGDAAVLATVRYEHGQQQELSLFSGRLIRTVADHIREYGCLLTSYTMLLRDAGAHVSVADLYRANYGAMTGRSFDADAQQGSVTLFDLNSTPVVVARATGGAFQSAGGILGADPAQELRALLARVGSVIIRTERAGSEHWIVVDGANLDGSFNVRDPMRGQQLGVLMGGDEGVSYPLAPSATYVYLQPGAARQT